MGHARVRVRRRAHPPLKRTAAALVLLLGAPAALTAQSFADAARALARGDTSGAIAAYEAIVRRDLGNAEAHYRAGMLYLSRHPAGSDLSPNRRKAEEHLRYATRFAGDSAKYWLGLADVFRSEDMASARLQVRGLVRKARAAAAAQGDDALLAEAALRIARVDWEHYEHYAHRAMPATIGGPSAVPGLDAPWREVREFYHERIRFPGTDVDVTLGEVEQELLVAARAAPRRVDVVGLLLLTMGETDRWADAAALSRRLVGAAPDSGRAWALYGLALARNGAWDAAERAFARGLARMTPADAEPYRNLEGVLRSAERVRYAALGDDGRPQADSAFWDAARALTLTGTNEARTEFYARITYAQLRWSDAWRATDGPDTDIGAIFVRYGPPDLWATFDRSRISWLYEDAHLHFTFVLTPGYARARFAGTSAEAARVAADTSPVRFDNVPLYRTLDTILVQTARFRGAADSDVVAVVGAVPLGRMAGDGPLARLPLASSARLTDSAGRTIAAERRADTVDAPADTSVQYRAWRLAATPGRYTLRVEALVPPLDRGARGRQPLVLTPLPRDRLALSDILVATAVTPLDSHATRWTDYLLEPNAGRFRVGESVGLLWEIYQLSPDSTASTRYDVDVRIVSEAIERPHTFAAIIGGVADALGLTAVGDDRVSITYHRSATATPDAARAEYLMIDLKDAPAGRYRIEVVVRDAVRGTEASATRTITVGADPVRR